MDAQTEYLAGLRRLLREEAPFDPVKQVIRARLEGARLPVHGLVSPPLGRDDVDTSLLLLCICTTSYGSIRMSPPRNGCAA